MQDTERIVPASAPTETGTIEAAPAAGEAAAPSSADPTTPPSAASTPEVAGQEGAADPDRIGLWECLNEPRNCELAAPDPRTKGKYFEGPTQDVARSTGSVACPSCKGEKVLYQGEKIIDAAVAA